MSIAHAVKTISVTPQVTPWGTQYLLTVRTGYQVQRVTMRVYPHALLRLWVYHLGYTVLRPEVTP